MLGLKGLLNLFAEAHDGTHVDFVESGKDRGGLLGIDQLQSDLAAERGELAAGYSPFGYGTGCGGSHWCGGGWLGSLGLGFHLGLCFFLGHVSLRTFAFSLFGCLGRRIDLTDSRSDRHLGSLGDGDLHDSGFKRGDLRGALVGVEGEEEFADGVMVAVFCVPGGKDTGGDGFADGRDEDWDAHIRMGWREVVGK